MMIFVGDEAASRLVDRNKRAHRVTARITEILFPSFLIDECWKGKQEPYHPILIP